MVSPSTTEMISTISRTKLASCKRNQCITPHFLKDLISSLWLPVHTGKKNSKSSYSKQLTSLISITVIYIHVIKAWYETITAVSCFHHTSLRLFITFSSFAKLQGNIIPTTNVFFPDRLRQLLRKTLGYIQSRYSQWSMLDRLYCADWGELGESMEGSCLSILKYGNPERNEKSPSSNEQT